MYNEQEIIGSYTCQYCGQRVPVLSNDYHMCHGKFNANLRTKVAVENIIKIEPAVKNPTIPTSKELAKLGRKNQGWRIIRTTLPELPIEREFAEEWQEINSPVRSVNYGHGTLQDLFISGGIPFNTFNPQQTVRKITPMDKMIVATVIQWLGSPVGFGFLTKVLDKCGFEIVTKK